MVSPIEPQVCKRTGRLLTEWFEFPEYDDKELEEVACALVGLTLDQRPRLEVGTGWDHPEEYEKMTKINAFIGKRKRSGWKQNMTKAEVQTRMNEATKMIDPENFKFLNDDVRERTGLELNPLWMMECLIRSGLLNPKEQVAALTQLASYTHSKAPSISHSTHTNMKPEDWLLELAKEEYTVVDIEKIANQPKQPVERGTTKKGQKLIAQRVAATQALHDYSTEQLAALEALFEDAEFEDVKDDE